MEAGPSLDYTIGLHLDPSHSLIYEPLVAAPRKSSAMSATPRNSPTAGESRAWGGTLGLKAMILSTISTVKRPVKTMLRMSMA